MKDKVKELLAHIKGVKPSYFIQYTVEDGEIVILEARKTFPVDGKEHPNMIWGDAMAELRHLRICLEHLLSVDVSMRCSRQA